MPRTLRITLTAAVLFAVCAVLGAAVADHHGGFLGAVEVVVNSGLVFFGVFAVGGALAVLAGRFHRPPRTPAV